VERVKKLVSVIGEFLLTVMVYRRLIGVSYLTILKTIVSLLFFVNVVLSKFRKHGS